MTFQLPEVGCSILAAICFASRMAVSSSDCKARAKAFRAMAFSAGDHFRSRMVHQAWPPTRGKLAIFRSSWAAFYPQPRSHFYRLRQRVLSRSNRSDGCEMRPACRKCRAAAGGGVGTKKGNLGELLLTHNNPVLSLIGQSGCSGGKLAMPARFSRLCACAACERLDLAGAPLSRPSHS